MQEYTEELYKKDLQNLHSQDGVITHLEPDILECEVRWALGSITMNKASAAAAKLLQSSLSPRQQPTSLARPWDSPGKKTGMGCNFFLQCVKVKNESEVTQSCLICSNPMDCSPPSSSAHEIFQARVLEWGAIAFSTL